MGKLFIVTGPSGAGKTKVTEEVIDRGIGHRIITCTTRAPRANNGVMEVPGLDYHFLTPDEFTNMIHRGEFAEHAEVYGKFYGTRKCDIESALTHAGVALIVIDVQGAATLLRLYPEAVSVFISISRGDMESRLLLRGNLPEEIAARLAALEGETAKAAQFHEVIQNPNGCLMETVNALIALMKR